MSKKILSFLIIVFLLVTIFTILFQSKKDQKFVLKEVQAGTEHNVWGWAWSGVPQAVPPEKLGVGWISFNCNNPELPAPRCTNNYGVNINNTTGLFSGYAWSENIGWIKFGAPLKIATENYPTCPPTTCPGGSPNYPARLDSSTGKVTGWARACAGTVNGDCNSSTRTDGWDGWILLGPIVKGGTDYGVYIDPTTSPAQFKNWAWGSDVVGWISFNCSNQGICGTSDYKVLTSFSFNRPPVAEIWCCPNGCDIDNCPTPGVCSGFRGTFCLKNNSSDPDNNLANSIWRIIGTGETYDCQITGNPTCNLTPSNPVGNYTAQLEVIDTEGLSDTDSISFELKADIYAEFKCSLNPSGPWQECESIRPKVGQDVYFNASDYSFPSTGATITSWSWTFTDGSPATTTNNPNPSTQFQTAGQDKEVTLVVQDSAGRSASRTHYIDVSRWPIWFPIPPR